ncbi:MAG TPA: hypothetical protein VG733_09420 [Chthoniobacteraceae bacterium]|nr:hypothetical protein [Chthoniobacteraceae bacterium]
MPRKPGRQIEPGIFDVKDAAMRSAHGTPRSVQQQRAHEHRAARRDAAHGLSPLRAQFADALRGKFAVPVTAGITRSAPLLSSQSSRCKRTVNICSRSSPGGCACGTPSFMLHGPKPGASARAANASVRSWCHATSQFAPGVLSK